MPFDRSGIKRGALLAGAAGLVLSHGLALWRGMAAGAEEGRSELGTSKTEHRTSHQERGDEAAAGNGVLDELLKSGLAREAADKREAEEAAKDEVREARLAAAREKIPANASLKALLDAAALRKENFSMESVAAFSLWLDQDEAAAITWLDAAARYRSCAEMSLALQGWLGGDGRHARLAELLESNPALGPVLLDAAGGLAKKRGAEFALRLAQGLAWEPDRKALVEQVMEDGEFLKSHLAEIRPLLGEGYELLDRMLEVLGKVEDAGPAVEELLKSAGFSERVVTGYHYRDLTRSTVVRSSGYDLMEVPLEQRGAYVGWAGAPWHAKDPEAEKKFPELPAWCAEMRERRMPPEEVMTRAKAVWPEMAGQEAYIRTLVFRHAFAVDPVASLQWLTGVRGEDCWKDLHEGVNELQPEQIVDLLEALPDLPGRLVGDFRYRALRKLEDWRQDDPEHAEAVFERLEFDAERGGLVGLKEGQGKEGK